MAVKKKSPAKTKKSLRVRPPKPKLQDHFFVSLHWANGQGASGVVSDVHSQDKGSVFNIFSVQQHASKHLSTITKTNVVAVLTNFMSVTKAEAELYSREFQEFRAARTAEVLAQQEANKKAMDEAAKNETGEVPVPLDSEVEETTTDIPEVREHLPEAEEMSEEQSA